MHLAGPPDLGHLTYCTNIHPGESWDEVYAGLSRHLPEVKAAVSPDAPMGVGLRLSARAAEDLTDPPAMDTLRKLLQETGCYVFTINGFPYGAFHGGRVKEKVYAPDWSTPERLQHSNRLADQLATLLPDGLTGSVSTVPGTFKPWADEKRVAAIADNLIRHAAHLLDLQDRTGKTITLALEPEPFCLLETIEETIAFFESHLFSPAAASRFLDLTGANDSETALRRHLNVCYDVCHAAVEYEDPRASIAALRAAGIGIAKLQLSSALKVASVDDETVRRLTPFAEPTYLHQTIERRNGVLIRYLDLPDAFAANGEAHGHEWRSHFHVPIFLGAMDGFDTTQDFLRDILDLHREKPIAPHLEVETYTWDVLPERYRTSGLSEAIARELTWVLDELA